MSSRRETRESSSSEVKSSKSYDDDADADDYKSHQPDGHDRGTRGSSKEHRRRSRSRSPNRKRRSPSRERRRSRSRDRERDRRRFHDRNKHGSRRHSPDRGKDDDRRSGHSHYRRRERRSRSSSTERHERDRERSKLELRQQMARNYEEQIEKMKNNQFGPPPQPNKYPNQVPVDPSKLVEQIEKRKFLFSKKDKPAAEVSSSSTAVWKNTAFTDDSDGKVSAKFKRLMGMKEDEPSSTVSEDPDSAKKRDEYLANLEQQYEVARATTHTQRGVGFGFSSSRIFPVHPKP